MMDIKFIRENADKVKEAAKVKRIDVDIDQLLDLDTQRRSLMTELEGLQAAKNQASKEIPKLAEEERKIKLLEMKEVDLRSKEISEKLKGVVEEYDNLMAVVPNVPSPETPVGPDESGNLPWSYWSPALGHVDPKDGKIAEIPTKFEFEIKDHVTLAQNLDLLDLEAGVKTAGFRGYYLKNEGVLLHYGIIWHALQKLRAKGFTLMATPTMAREFAFFGSGHFPTGIDNQYKLVSTVDDPDKEQLYLAGTSEPALLAYYADKILDEKDLPIKLCGVSQCYRSEIGSYGKDTKGIYRIHEFMKVEQVVICKADMMESENWHEALREIAEEMLQDLKLPYRVVNVCTGDMGAGKYKMYDIETWMPSRANFGETHSDSNLTDWQARRLNLRYKDASGKIRHAFTLNNTVVASPRILIAILENYQQEDGSILVPEILRPYVGKEVIAAASNSK